MDAIEWMSTFLCPIALAFNPFIIKLCSYVGGKSLFCILDVGWSLPLVLPCICFRLTSDCGSHALICRILMLTLICDSVHCMSIFLICCNECASLVGDIVRKA